MLLGSLLVLLLLAGAGPAAGHAALRSLDPADGTVLPSAPRALTLTFTESVGLLDDTFRLFGPDGRRVRTDPAEHAPGRADTARVAFPAGLGRGTFTVAWRVVSADSHPVSGAFTFSVGSPSAAPAVATGRAEDPLTRALHGLARAAAYGGAALLIGTAAFVLLCRPPDARPSRGPLAAGWWTLLVSTLALLLLRSPYETGAGPAAALDPSALAHTLTGRPGLALVTRLALLAPTALIVRRLPTTPTTLTMPTMPAARTARAAQTTRATPTAQTAQTAQTTEVTPTAQATATTPVAPTPPITKAAAAPLAPALTLSLALALALTWAVSDHAAAGVQVPWAMASAVLHLLAMAVWLGGLTALLTTLQGAARAGRAPVGGTAAESSDGASAEETRGSPVRDAQLTATVTRFSRLAVLSVTVLVLTGTYQSWRGLGSPAALPGTTYGRLLLAKLLAVALLGVLAARSRRWTARLAEAMVPASPAAQPLEPEAVARALRRSVLAEAAVGIAVLVITTVLGATPPGRTATEAAAARDGAALTAGVPGSSVTVIPFDTGSPGGRGRVQITLEPGRVGQNAVEAVVFGPDGGLSAVPELRLSLSLSAKGIGPIDARLTDRGGYWGTDTLTLPLTGTWTAKATVRVSELDQASASRTVRILR
ncbi:copper resistance CopC/CopD family protein [Streptomyces mexicanus]|uniref:copper resistance CopC/CopD family protein n=1 Tax=Streptomyces mexicanus TaxID=178566 RepID=UPI0031EAD70D